MRDECKLAILIERGLIRRDPSNPCACGNPLLHPVSFNAVSKVDGAYICERCNGWETVEGVKYPVTDNREECGQ